MSFPFYYNNKILVKRVIAVSGEWVNIDIEGNVYVNGTLLEEPYLESKAFGDCNIELPYQVLMEKCLLSEITELHRLTQEIPQLAAFLQEQIVERLCSVFYR